LVVEGGPGGAAKVNHQVIGPGQLRTRLETLLLQAMNAVPEASPSVVPTKPPEPMVIPAQPVTASAVVAAPSSPAQAQRTAKRFCSRCGGQLVEGGRFCGQCGAVANA